MKKSIITILALCFLTFSACAQSSKPTGDKSMGTTINVTVNGVTKTATLVDNVATKDLLELLSKGNIIIKTDEMDGQI